MADSPTASSEEVPSAPPHTTVDDISNLEHHPLVIIGGGIGGLVLALCLDQVYNHSITTDDANGEPITSSSVKFPIHVYESTAEYSANAGGAIGLYPNGLRVLRNLSRGSSPSYLDSEHVKFGANCPNLLQNVRTAGCDYIYRRWMRHDGLQVAVAREDELLPDIKVDESEMAKLEVLDESEKGTGSRSSAVSRADSTKSQDVEGERANRRPRGGSFANAMGALEAMKDMSQNLSQRLSRISFTGSDATTTSAAGGSDKSTPRASRVVDTELLSLGIRRWKYQQVLYDQCKEVGIQFHMGKRLQSVTSIPASGEDGDAKSLLLFKDGSRITASLVIGADGINSKVRNYVTNPKPTAATTKQQEEYVPAYTGVTCLMGCASVPRIRGICFPSSATTKCHACYYPTRAPKEVDDEGNADDAVRPVSGDYEQVFQIYFPSPIERPDTWRTLTPTEAKEECRELAKKLREDGWDEQFLAPLESETLTGVLRVGLRSREALDVWHVGGSIGVASGEDNDDVGRAVLLGDAAHPPVPYIGQGAMMAMEDAGTLALLLARYCPLDTTNSPTVDFSLFKKAMHAYESLRVSRTKTILGSSVELGKTQQKRAESKLYNAWREWSIKAQVWAYGTLPVMRPGAASDYMTKVEEVVLE